MSDSTSLIHLDLVQAIFDYPGDDLAASEVTAALTAAGQRVLGRIVPVSTTRIRSFNTIEAGFVAGQLGLLGPDLRPECMLLYINVAGRTDDRQPRLNNAGEPLVYGRLSTGVHVLAVNSGYTLSLLRQHFECLHLCNVSCEGTQFRSARNFPQAVAMLAAGDFESLRGAAVSPDSIPEFPTRSVGYVDSFGNIKTTDRETDPFLSGLAFGDTLEVRIGDSSQLVTYRSGLFAGADGEWVYYPGSSGNAGGYFMEIAVRSGNAARELGYPAPGAQITFDTVHTGERLAVSATA